MLKVAVAGAYLVDDDPCSFNPFLVRLIFEAMRLGFRFVYINHHTPTRNKLHKIRELLIARKESRFAFQI
jgi:hypothetical protein